jgi:CRP/FNR family cyclic AMP-dependent transcriptional regulator
VLDTGPWDAVTEYGDRSTWVGLLVLDGFLTREMICEQETTIELMGPGDLLRPWDHDGDYALDVIQTRWRVLQPVKLALLDQEFALRIARWPTLIAEILSRMGRRNRWLAVRLTISQLSRINARIAYFFWHLAERWGHTTREGIVIPLPLTHEQIAELIGAERPSVSLALQRLRDQGFVERMADESWRVPLDLPQRLESFLRNPDKA